MTDNSFENLNLDENLLKGIYLYGFINPSPIQVKGIKVIASGKDCILQSQSGTGKTATYLLGALKNVDKNKYPQVIILTPTRELAEQVNKVALELAKFSTIPITLCVGGTEINSNTLKNSSIIIGTIGRIFHMIKEGNINTSNIKTLIVDEADDMLSCGFKEKVIQLIEKIKNPTFQKCFLSATVNKNLREIAKVLLKDPEMVLIKKEEVSVKAIKQFYFNVENEEYKFDTLLDLYKLISTSHTMIFCNTIKKVEWLSKNLMEKDFPITTIHGSMTPEERNKIVQEFRDGKTRLLLTTDLLARGIDIPEVKLVINYDLPGSHETYIHRIGRSGRFGKKGVAITLVKMEDENDKKNFIRLKTHYKITMEEIPDNISDYLV